MENFNILSFLDKAKRRLPLTEFEVHEFTKHCTHRTIPDYQISSFLMAAAIHGLSEQEMFWFTDAITKSGRVYDLEEQKKQGLILIDKHSSGGVGDKMTITLSPLLACAGITVVKESGRGLGFSGGTIDKIESIGIKTTLSIEEITDCIKKANIAVFAPSIHCAPADEILYALRDVTATADSLSLTASSIMSKKLAFGTEYLFLDIKYGSGAFFREFELASELAKTMTAIGKASGKTVVTHMSTMQQPLGRAVGSAIELLEVQNFFKGKPTSPDYQEIALHFVGQVLVTTGKAKTLEEAKQKLLGYIKDGSALKAMERWIEAQGGDVESFRNGTYFNPKYKLDVLAPKSGYFGIIDNQQTGNISCKLGAGRVKVDDQIDFQAGIYLHKKLNDMVNEGEVMYTFYSSNPIDESLVDEIIKNTDLSQEKHKVDTLIMRYEE